MCDVCVRARFVCAKRKRRAELAAWRAQEEGARHRDEEDGRWLAVLDDGCQLGLAGGGVPLCARARGCGLWLVCMRLLLLCEGVNAERAEWACEVA